MRWPVLYLLEGDGIALAQQPLVRLLDGSVWIGESGGSCTITARLEEAIAAYQAALQEVTREHAPLMWASIQCNLGAVLVSLGERKKETARLEEAVVAYQAALQEYIRELMPFEWARTQNNLGIALASLGARENGTARLEEAVTALRAAQQELTRERVPLEWASIQSNLGTVLEMLSHRVEGDGNRKCCHPTWNPAVP